MALHEVYIRKTTRLSSCTCLAALCLGSESPLEGIGRVAHLISRWQPDSIAPCISVLPSL